jgi:hypothetical protein
VLCSDTALSLALSVHCAGKASKESCRLFGFTAMFVFSLFYFCFLHANLGARRRGLEFRGPVPGALCPGALCPGALCSGALCPGALWPEGLCSGAGGLLISPMLSAENG